MLVQEGYKDKKFSVHAYDNYQKTAKVRTKAYRNSMVVYMNNVLIADLKC